MPSFLYEFLKRDSKHNLSLISSTRYIYNVYMRNTDIGKYQKEV